MADEAPDAAPIVLDDTDAQVSSRGHRQLDEIWTCYKKVKLTSDQCAKLHRRYDASCNSCSKVLPGKPALLRQHTANCKKADLGDQVFALQQQEKAGGTQSTDSNGSNSDTGSMYKYVDKVQVTSTQLKHWRMLLAVAFIMTGWSFATVENPHFVDFMQHVRPSFELPSKAIAVAAWGLLSFSACNKHACCRCLSAAYSAAGFSCCQCQTQADCHDEECSIGLSSDLDIGWLVKPHDGVNLLLECCVSQP